jgi:hypothetical protein
MVCISFIDCESVSINGNADGLFNIGFVYYTDVDIVDFGNELDMTINNQTYTGFIISHQVNKLRNTPVGVECNYWTHNFQLVATSPVAG